MQIAVLRDRKNKVSLPKKMKEQLANSSMLSLSGFHLCELLDKKYLKRNVRRARCFY